MKSYNRPDIELLDTMEGVYAASGSSVLPTPTPEQQIPTPPFKAKFWDTNCGGYSVVEFSVGPANWKNIKCVEWNIEFVEGLKHNKLDNLVEVSHSGPINHIVTHTKGTNVVKIQWFVNSQNSGETLDDKLKFYFNHDKTTNYNNNENYGSYNGFTTGPGNEISEAERDVIRSGFANISVVVS